MKNRNDREKETCVNIVQIEVMVHTVNTVSMITTTHNNVWDTLVSSVWSSSHHFLKLKCPSQWAMNNNSSPPTKHQLITLHIIIIIIIEHMIISEADKIWNIKSEIIFVQIANFCHPSSPPPTPFLTFFFCVCMCHTKIFLRVNVTKIEGEKSRKIKCHARLVRVRTSKIRIKRYKDLIRVLTVQFVYFAVIKRAPRVWENKKQASKQRNKQINEHRKFKLMSCMIFTFSRIFAI